MTTHIPPQKKRTSSMSVMSKNSKSQRPFSSLHKSGHVEVFNEVLKWLETIACSEIRTRAIAYGMIFTGFYLDVTFEFNVYVNGQGHLNRKTRQNPVWHKPVKTLDMLRDEIDEVIQCIKSVDGTGDVTALQGHSDRDRRWRSFLNVGKCDVKLERWKRISLCRVRVK